MESWIAGAMAVLGTLLVLAGGTLIVLRTLGRLPTAGAGPQAASPDAPTLPGVTLPAGRAAGEEDDAATEPDGAGSWWRLSPANQLLAWGILLLVLASLVAGLITFDIGLSTGAR